MLLISAYNVDTQKKFAVQNLTELRQVIDENLCRYEPFEMFSAGAEIPLTGLETPLPPSAPIQK